MGQDGNDLVGGKPGPSKNDYQDVHLQVRGIPPNRRVVETIVKGLGGGEWGSGKTDNFAALLVRKGNAIQADVYIEPYQRETGREFEVHLKYDDGAEAVAIFPGGKADPSLRLAGVGIEVKWLGQDGQDRAGPSPNVGPDGLEDAHLAIGKLPPKTEVKSVEVTGPGGLAWHSGQNPGGHPGAEFVRNPGDRTRADLYCAPGVDLAGKGAQGPRSPTTTTGATSPPSGPASSTPPGRCLDRPRSRSPAARRPPGGWARTESR